MITYTYSKARQNFSSVLNKVKEEGEVLIKRKDGELFKIELYKCEKSPLDVKSIDLSPTVEEILEIIRETRER